jgi:hypothetical protein
MENALLIEMIEIDARPAVSSVALSVGMSLEGKKTCMAYV